MIAPFAIDLETGKIEVTLPSLTPPVYLIVDDLVDTPPMTPQQQAKTLRWFEETMKGRPAGSVQLTGTRRRMRRGK